MSVLENYIVRFDKNDRSSFPYWFAHWCAFNITALNYKRWKFKYLFHDIEKPFLKLFISYSKLQRFHNLIHKHHLLHYFVYNNADWEAMFIDWECGRLTKQQCPRNAVNEYYRIFKQFEEYINEGKISDNKSIRYFEDHNLNKEELRPLIINAYNQLYKTFKDNFNINVNKYNEHYLLK